MGAGLFRAEVEESCIACRARLIHKQILLPLLLNTPSKFSEEGDMVGSERFPNQVHACLIWRAIAFLVIAPDACSYQILPGIGSTP